VLEHIPSPSAASARHAAVEKGGLFVSFTPNGSEGYGRVRHWNKLWARSIQLLDDRFLDWNFRRSPRTIVRLDMGAALPTTRNWSGSTVSATTNCFSLPEKLGNW